MIKNSNVILLIVTAILLGGCVSQEVISCSESNNLIPYCGFQNPEDLVLTPDGKQIIVSEMGTFMLDTPGSLSLFDLPSKQKMPLDISWQSTGEVWGDSDCSVPEGKIFSPHGIDLITRDDGKHQLLVVNHGGRESVEFFQLSELDNKWVLNWKGCAIPPEDPFINDVAGLQNGGFLVTHMWNKHLPFEEVVEMITAGVSTGWVWEWSPRSGFTKVAGSTQQMPNGIVVSKDNTKAFINIYIGNKTIKLDLESGQIEGEVAVQQPDNVSIDGQGNLWIASHRHDPINETCDDVKEGPCLLPFVIVRADSETMQAKEVLSQVGLPMGYATVAIPVGNRLYMGSAHGDRIISAPLPE
jgi:hypothetical protein